MKLTVHLFTTLDGVVQGPGAPEEDVSGGFARGGWLVPFADQDMGTIVESWFDRCDAILLGRTTYQLMQPYWTSVTDPDNGVAAALNGRPKYVASSTLTDPTWQHTTVLGGDVVGEVARLKQQDGGELQVHGSAGLARALHEAGLVDEYRLLAFPVVVGAGKRLFDPAGPASGFRLVDSRTTSTGAVYTALAPVPFDTGSVAVEDGREVV